MKTKMGFLLIMLLFSLFSLSAEENIISYLEGEVTVYQQGEEMYADFGTSLFQGDRISTGSDGLVIIELVGGRVLKMKENSTIVMENMGNDTSLRLTQGSVFTKVQKLTSGSFSVRTETVVAGVRGTQFFLSYGESADESEESDIWLCVNEGTVEVGLSGTDESVLVNEGEGISILSGKKLTNPRPYDWTNDLNWNVDPSAGNVKDTTDLEGIIWTPAS